MVNKYLSQNAREWLHLLIMALIYVGGAITLFCVIRLIMLGRIL